MTQPIKVWFDAEGDFLEVRFSDRPGYMRETDHDAVMERVDQKGHLLGFSIVGVSQFSKASPIVAELTAQQTN
jgi:hypothetical protein